METRKILTILVLALGLVLCRGKFSEAADMGTAFTYQGRLIDANEAADGLYDFQFKLYDDPNVNQAVADVNVPAVDVIDGYFTVQLDFGSQVFDGNALWLGIGVRPGELNDPNAYAVLIPRQEVKPTPYALYAKNAGNGLTGSGTTNRIAKFTGPNTLGDSALYDHNDYVGIGTTNPRTELEIKGTTGLRVTTGQHSNVFGEFRHAYSGGLQINANAGGGWADISLQTDNTTRVFVESGGNVGIGTTSPSRKLTVRGNLLIESTGGSPVAELGEGLDYAEGFDVTTADAVEPGSVLIIDPDNSGKLTISRLPYDKRVAGIAAGGKGLGSGVRLGVDGFDCDVALAGRVYCSVDATEVGVERGDMLTTSSTVGYAMKAVDSGRAHGAILGKAMEPLEKGKTGQILVLVTLQ
jgi:hypothetical protein